MKAAVFSIVPYQRRHPHGGWPAPVSRGHQLLTERYRVIAFEAPGFGSSPVNGRSASMAEVRRDSDLLYP